MTKTIDGVLHLYSETGTEGGYWAVQDNEYITPPPEDPQTKVCKTCHCLWSFNRDPEPVPSFTYYRAARTENGKNYSGGYYSSPVEIPDGQTAYGDEPDDSFNDLYIKASNEQAAKCLADGHNWEFYKDVASWDREGMHFLRNGDVLTVFDPEDSSKELWTGEVKLLSNGDQYAAGAKNALGWVIHEYPDPEMFPDLDSWSKMFLMEFPARLTISEEDDTIQS